MTWSEISDTIGIIVGVIGIIVGIIGGKSLSKANKIRAKVINESNVNQAEEITIINNGPDTYAIMKIAKDVTQEELTEIIERLTETDQRIREVKEEFDNQPKILSGVGPPPNELGKNGDVYIETFEEDSL